MKIGIIRPSKVNEKHRGLISKLAKIISDKGHEIVITPDKGSSSEYFAQEYLSSGGKKVFSVLPLDDKEFGYSWVNTSLGEQINCNTWRNQPEKINEETEALLCIGHAVGGMIEIGYTKWFNKKPVYIITEITTERFPSRIEEELDLRYLSIEEFENAI